MTLIRKLTLVPVFLLFQVVNSCGSSLVGDKDGNADTDAIRDPAADEAASDGVPGDPDMHDPVGDDPVTTDDVFPDTADTSDTIGPDAPDSTDTPAEDAPPARTGSIDGTVMSPQCSDAAVINFPVSGALVYVTHTMPAALPEGVHCYRCPELGGSVPHTWSSADGTFRIDNIAEGAWMLVVEKGGFRKVTDITVVPDTVTPVPIAQTTLPNTHAPPGDTVPHIAMALGSFDMMEDILAKMGLCPINVEHRWSEGACDHVDMYDNGGAPMGSGLPTFASLLTDLDLMRQYQIIFIPCSGSITDTELSNPTVLANMRQYVEEGGKLFVADWSYDFVEQPFPDFIDFEDNDLNIGAADVVSTSFDTTGAAVDDGLRDWLTAIGEPPDSVVFEENWDCIAALGTVPGFDEDGNPINITPFTWAEGPITRGHACMAGDAPLTLTFISRCGRILYTTYHTVGNMGGPGRPNLIPQEKILLYLILEMLGCR